MTDAQWSIRSASDLTPLENQQIEALMRNVFAGDPYNDLVWADVDWYVLARVAGELVSMVEILQRVILAGSQTVRVGGIGGVATVPEWRGCGLATRALQAAAEFLHQRLNLPFGLLICSPALVPFYEGLGWGAISDNLYFDQPAGKMKNDGMAMILPLGGQSWPQGDVDLCGLPW